MNTITAVYFFVGAFIVFIFAVNYFNQPSYKFADDDKSINGDQEDLMLEPALPKYLTDRFEYNLYLIAYVLVTQAIYVLLVLFLPDLLSGGSKEISNTLAPTRQNIVLAALIITGIAPNLPYIRKLLESSKLYLHEKAQIPRKGRDVYRQIKNYRPHYTKAEITNILKDDRYVRRDKNGQILRMDLSESDFELGEWTLEGRWAKLSYLHSYVNRWAKKSPFSSYIGNRELQRSSIERAYNALHGLMIQYKAGELSEHESVRLNSRLDAALHRTYRLISCLLYLAGKTDSVVDVYLDQLGYLSAERNDFPIPWKNLVFVIVAIAGSITAGGFLAFFISQLGIEHFNPTIRTQNIFKWVGYAVPFLSVPLLLVLFIKHYLSLHSEAWPVITENNRYMKLGDRPWQVYAIVALLAYLIGGVVLFGISAIVKVSDGGKINDLPEMLRSAFVWAGIVLVTAGFMAYRLDSAPPSGRPKLKHFVLRSSGALLQGVITTFAVYIAFMHTFANGNLNLLRLPDIDQSKLSVYCLIAFILGAALYTTSSFGRLRQRRNSWRRRVRRSVIVHSQGEVTSGNTVNVSREGALVESHGYFPVQEKTVEISDNAGTSTQANIVGRRGNYLHLHFLDEPAWHGLKGKLEIPAAT